MMWDYARFDFGESYFRSISVIDLGDRETAGVDLAGSVVDADRLPGVDPAGHPQGHAGTDRKFDTWTSGVIIVAYADPGFLFAILLLIVFAGGRYFQILPAARPDVRTGGEDMTLIQQIGDLLLAHHAAGAGLDHIGLRHADAADQEFLSRTRSRSNYVMTAAGQGAEGEPRALRAMSSATRC